MHVCVCVHFLFSKVMLLEGGDGNIHLKNLSLHLASNEEEGIKTSMILTCVSLCVHTYVALNWLFLGDTNRMIAEVSMNDPVITCKEGCVHC